MTASKPMTPVFRVPPDWNWEEDDVGGRLGECFVANEVYDEDGEPTGEYSHALWINFGRSPGYAREKQPRLPASKLIEKLAEPAQCSKCGDDFEFGFEYEKQKMCLLCFETAEGIHWEDWGYGHECLDCGLPAAYMFMVDNDIFEKYFPDGGIICLVCFSMWCHEFADHLWRIILHVEEDFVPEQFRVLTTAG